ncbi:hypothetical protein U9M48_004968 [Paspalum notatum var. saurae]|uniref:RNase H type-1 domain-containing protein n=1 Tax=Paspalum notatum var. saurae TaxID=547442 RepID=A0AAQ3SF61_PASNO
MAQQDTCALCGDRDSWRHSLLECNMAKCVWALESEEIVEHMCMIPYDEVRLWVAEVMSTLKHADLTRVLVTLWAIWYARLKAIHENIFQSPFSTHSFTSTAAKTRKVEPRWISPPAGVVKVNADAAISKNRNLGAAAAVARDSDGGFMGASSLVVEGIADAETMEAIASREGLALASDLAQQ